MESDIERARQIAKVAYSNSWHLFEGVDGSVRAVDLAMWMSIEDIRQLAKEGDRTAYLAGQLLITKALATKALKSKKIEDGLIADMSRFYFGKGAPPKGRSGQQAIKLNKDEQAKTVYWTAKAIIEETNLNLTINSAREGDSALTLIAQEFSFSLSTAASLYKRGADIERVVRNQIGI